MKRAAPLLLIPAVLLLLWPAGRAAAHGGGALIAGPVPVGPYMLSLWQNPPDARAGEPLHFTVGLAAPEDGAPLLDATILITMQQPNGRSAPVSAPATTEQSINRLFYETDIELSQAGRYDTLIQVAGPRGSGELDLQVEVRDPSPINWLYVGLGGLAVVLILGWLRSRRTAVAQADES